MILQKKSNLKLLIIHFQKTKNFILQFLIKNKIHLHQVNNHLKILSEQTVVNNLFQMTKNTKIYKINHLVRVIIKTKTYPLSKNHWKADPSMATSVSKYTNLLKTRDMTVQVPLPTTQKIICSIKQIIIQINLPIHNKTTKLAGQKNHDPKIITKTIPDRVPTTTLLLQNIPMLHIGSLASKITKLLLYLSQVIHYLTIILTVTWNQNNYHPALVSRKLGHLWTWLHQPVSNPGRYTELLTIYPVLVHILILRIHRIQDLDH